MRVLSVADRSLAVLVALVIGLVASAPTNAQMLRCASTHLKPAERDALSSLTHRVLPPNSGPLALESACTNLDFALAFYRTPTVVDSDGLNWWWSIRCDRQTRAWSCASAKREQRVMINIANGSSNISPNGNSANGIDIGPFEGRVPEGLAAPRAIALYTSVAILATKSEAPLAHCSGHNRGDDWSSARRPSWFTPAGDIEMVGATAVASVGELAVRFDEQDQPVCWYELLVLT